MSRPKTSRETHDEELQPLKDRREHIIWRYIVAATLALLPVVLIINKMVHTTVTQAAAWREKANIELMTHDTIMPRRGDILASDGSLLATNLTAYTLRIDYRADNFSDKKFRESLDSLCDTLARYYPVRDRDAWKDNLSAPLAMKRGERPRSRTLLRDLTYDQMQQVRTFPYFRRFKTMAKAGLTADPVVKRCYPYGEMARRSVGRTGQTETCKEVHGISGLEMALDSLLYGEIGYAKRVPLTHRVVNWTDIAPRNGATITTTIDVALQDLVEDELNKQLQEMEADWGTAILMQVDNGDIKAICNLERDADGNYVESLNHAVQGFEPGSVMKTVSMIVALEDGFVTDYNQTYNTAPYVFGGGKAIEDTHGPAMKPVNQFLRYSSNVGMTKLVAPHYWDNPNGFRERLRDMGFFEPFNTGIAGECPPYFGNLDIKSGGRVDLGRQTYGYTSLIPPLYMCAIYNAVANDGRFVRPRLVSRITDATHDSIVEVSYVRDRICSPENARLLRSWLREVIYEKGGTAPSMKGGNVVIAGKTGTAKIANELSLQERQKIKANPTDTAISRPKGYTQGQYRFAFCGFFPYEAPKYTCMVLVSRPSPAFRNAGKVSGTVVKAVAERMYSMGALGGGPDWHTDGARGTRNIPLFFASAAADAAQRIANLRDFTGATAAGRIQTPAKVAAGVPDVKGMGLREALVTIEAAGYEVKFSGAGYVAIQSPAPGVKAKPGSTVQLTLTRK